MSEIVGFSYTMNGAPEGYRCAACDAFGVKLWRQYSTFVIHLRLMCAACACKDQKVADDVDESGTLSSSILEMPSRTDQIGDLVLAVPTEDGETFWGYTSVPQPGVEWWKRLPTRAAVAK